jgi:pSer/pThr/pTyr-binding forkhead associated (FHA) protein/ribosomal protein L40E
MDVGLVCDTCAALNPIGAPQCSRCAAELAALDPRAQLRRQARANGAEVKSLRGMPAVDDVASDSDGTIGAPMTAEGSTGAMPDAVASAPRATPALIIDSAPVAADAKEAAPSDGEKAGDDASAATSEPPAQAAPGGGSDRPATKAAVQTGQQTASTYRCTRCGFMMKANLQFCPSCGLRVPSPFEVETKVRHQGRSTQFIRAMQVARAKLTLIRGDGEDGVSFMLAGEEHVAGRGADCPIHFPDDPFLSPQHVSFVYRDDQLVVIDLDSQNGVYLRVTEAELTAQTTFLVGEQVLSARMATTPADAAEADGTYFSCSMPRPALLEILQHLRGGVTGAVFRMETSVATVGREGNNIDFPEDPFISGRHAEIRLEGPSLSIKDLGSRNGTFVRINKEQVLRHGDYVFMGQQLLRVEIV